MMKFAAFLSLLANAAAFSSVNKVRIYALVFNMI